MNNGKEKVSFILAVGYVLNPEAITSSQAGTGLVTAEAIATAFKTSVMAKVIIVGGMCGSVVAKFGGSITDYEGGGKVPGAIVSLIAIPTTAGTGSEVTAFSWARLGDVHAMSHPISAFFNVPHGVSNAILLPTIVEYNSLAD